MYSGKSPTSHRGVQGRSSRLASLFLHNLSQGLVEFTTSEGP